MHKTQIFSIKFAQKTISHPTAPTKQTSEPSSLPYLPKQPIKTLNSSTTPWPEKIIQKQFMDYICAEVTSPLIYAHHASETQLKDCPQIKSALFQLQQLCGTMNAWFDIPTNHSFQQLQQDQAMFSQVPQT